MRTSTVAARRDDCKKLKETVSYKQYLFISAASFFFKKNSLFPPSLTHARLLTLAGCFVSRLLSSFEVAHRKVLLLLLSFLFWRHT